MLADVQVDTDKPEAGHDLGYWESVFRQK